MMLLVARVDSLHETYPAHYEHVSIMYAICHTDAYVHIIIMNYTDGDKGFGVYVKHSNVGKHRHYTTATFCRRLADVCSLLFSL